MNAILKKAQDHFNSRQNFAVKVPEWDTTIFCNSLSLIKRQELAKGSDDPANMPFIMAKVVAENAVDKEGNKIFGEVTPDLIIKLQNTVDSVVLNRVYLQIMDVPTVVDAVKN